MSLDHRKYINDDGKKTRHWTVLTQIKRPKVHPKTSVSNSEYHHKRSLICYLSDAMVALGKGAQGANGRPANYQVIMYKVQENIWRRCLAY